MSSHREAPEISKDPSADNTDVYAFRSPDKPGTVTLIANFIPFELPYGGPNFNEFADDVLYAIHISNGGAAKPDVSFLFRFKTKIRNANTFLYNTGQITSNTDPAWNRPQSFEVYRQEGAAEPVLLSSGLTCPPVNVGFRSTPDYHARFTVPSIHSLPGGGKVFAGQRADGFHVDLGSIFDLGALRPFQHLHLIPSADAVGVNGLRGLNVHTIALQLPLTSLTRRSYNPTDVADPRSVIGVWASASRQKSKVINRDGTRTPSGNFIQVSRLGIPLFNEVLTPMARKDYWNTQVPSDDAQFASYVQQPELAKLLPVLYPNVFPNLNAYTKNRADLDAIILTGIPSGVIAGFQNYTGSTKADMLRLNLAVAPTTKDPSPYGILGGDLAGFPNGRRPMDDVVAIELRAIAGATIPLVDPGFTPDGAAAVLVDGTGNNNGGFRSSFPYLNTPNSGFATKPGTPAI